jgi:4-hydroxy-3-methylbut-2-enyl diphosphate reductase
MRGSNLMTKTRTLVIASPRGFCAGVERAIAIADGALAQRGGQVFLRHPIVHNEHVVRDLEDRNAVFVEEIGEVPEGEVVILSAHGTAPDVVAESHSRGHQVIDATCPLVMKVHAAARRLRQQPDVDIVIVGHAGHQEVLGTLGASGPGAKVVSTVEECDALEVAPGRRVGLLFQTTLSGDDMAPVIRRLEERFPDLIMPKSDQICYATQNRQDAVKALADRCSLIVVVGSVTSSNCLRLVEVARAHGAEAVLVGSIEEVTDELLDHAVVGLTSGASTPESLVEEIREWYSHHGAETQILNLGDETIQFTIPTLRLGARAADADTDGR